MGRGIMILYIDMENANDMGIPVWVGALVFMCQHHDIMMRLGCDRILFTVCIICGVVDTEGCMLIEVVIFDEHTIPVKISEFVFVATVWQVAEAGKEVVFELYYEVL